LLIRNPKKDFYPEKHRDEGPLLVSDKEICPERAQRVEGSLLLSDEACLSRASTGSEGSLFIPDKKDFYPEEHRYEGPSSQWARIPAVPLSRSSIRVERPACRFLFCANRQKERGQGS